MSVELCSIPFQKQVVAAEVMVIPRSCSCSIQSMVAAPSCTSPILWRHTGVEQHPLSGGGFTCVYMCADTYVAIATDGVLRATIFSCKSEKRLSKPPVAISKSNLILLETEVRERLVGFCHAVHIFTFLNCASPCLELHQSARQQDAEAWTSHHGYGQYSTNQRIASAVRREGRTSTGT